MAPGCGEADGEREPFGSRSERRSGAGKRVVTATINGKTSSNDKSFVFLTASKTASSGVLTE
jgi:hypothetical protein